MFKMSIILKDECEVMAKIAKVINHSKPKQAVTALEVEHGMNKLSNAKFNNHLVTAVSKFDTKLAKFGRCNAPVTKVERR